VTKAFLTSLILHALLFVGLLGVSWQKSMAPRGSSGPMQVMILPDTFDIVKDPQPLRPLKKKKKRVRPKNTLKTSGQETTKPEGSPLDHSVAESDGSDSTSGGQADAGVERLRLSYGQALNLYISQNKYYPRKARRLKQSGVVSVRFRVTPRGEFEHVHLEKACDHSTLNQAALELIKKLGKFRPLPKDLADGQEFIVPINYKISRGI
jgi:TonB family protein